MQPRKTTTTTNVRPNIVERCNAWVILLALLNPSPLLVLPRWLKLCSPRSPFDVARTEAPTVVLVKTDVENVIAGSAAGKSLLSRNTSANDGAYTVIVQLFAVQGTV